MVDEFRSIRENLFKVLTGIGVAPGAEDGDQEDEDFAGGRGRGLDAGAARALVGALFARAGKGKDEVVQIIAREIGLAVAAMLKEPLSQLAKNQKLQISFEFVPKAGKAPATDDETAGAGDAAAAPGSRKPRESAAAAAAPKRTKRSSRRRKAGIAG